MKINFISFSFILFFLILPNRSWSQALPIHSENIMDDLDPFAPNIEQTLNKMDEEYERETGKAAFDADFFLPDFFKQPKCFQLGCDVYVQVVKSEQRLYLYVRGALQDSWLVSTGIKGYETPLFNTHPNGRIYDAYSSSIYPGGSYNGLGNMPYAVFIQGGFALHGTVEANWPHLGTKASHGCIRMHPDENQLAFNWADSKK